MHISATGSPVPPSRAAAAARGAEASTESEAPSVATGAPGLDPGADPRPFSHLQSPATLLETLPDGRMRIGGVRWGFDENGPAPSKDWEPRFSETTLDPSAVRDVYFATDRFNGIGHTFLVFELDPARPMVNARGESENRLAISVEARVKEGEVWSPVQGLKKGRYGLVYQLASFSDQVQKRCHGSGHPVEMRRLALDDSQKQALMRHALEESFKDRAGDYYHTTRNSCYTASLRMLDTVVAPSQRVNLRPLLPVELANPAAVVPSASGATLHRKGLLADKVDTCIQPDPKGFPDAQIKPGKLTAMARRLSDSPLFKPLLEVAGAVAGAAALAPTGLVGAVIGGLAGRHIADWTAAQMYTSSHLEHVSPAPWLGGGAPAAPAAGQASGVKAGAAPEGDPHGTGAGATSGAEVRGTETGRTSGAEVRGGGMSPASTQPAPGFLRAHEEQAFLAPASAPGVSQPLL